MGQNWGDGDSPMQGMEDTIKLHAGDVGKKVEFIYKVFSVQCGVMWKEGHTNLGPGDHSHTPLLHWGPHQPIHTHHHSTAM